MSMDNREDILKKIPQIEKLLQLIEIKNFIPIIGRQITVEIVREETADFRNNVKDDSNLQVNDLIKSIIKGCDIKRKEKLQRVINGTGVIIHTNLGRAPISQEILNSLSKSLSGYCNLEFHIPSIKRGKRGGYAEELISRLTSAEDALIVNNNASCVFLILSQFAKGKEVIVSRGELIQIGGGFRIPDIMQQTGAKLVEVGTTNITEIEDIQQAINENTAMILSAHQSNYRIEGFTKSPSLKEINDIRKSGILFVRDLGSGNLINEERLPQPFEPTISFELSQGPDLISFSGDKLLGGCQSGIIVGRKEYIQKLRNHPLMRMIRVDKITYFLIQETLLKYVNGEADSLALWKIIFQDKKSISRRIAGFLRKIEIQDIGKYITKIPLKSTFGGGSMPGTEIDSLGIHIHIPGKSPEELYFTFVSMNTPTVGYIHNDKYTLDFRTIFDTDIPALLKNIESLFQKTQEA